MKVGFIKPEYVEQLPDHLVEGVFYICEAFDLTAHKCCCGCGEDVFNKLSPVKWQLTKMPDGSVSLDPSVGNWKYACRSHYWIRKNRVVDAGQMSALAIKRIQRQDLRDRDRYIARINAQPDPSTVQRITTLGYVRAVFDRSLRRLKNLWPW